MKLIQFLVGRSRENAASGTDGIAHCGLLTERGVHDLTARFGATLPAMLADAALRQRCARQCDTAEPDHAVDDVAMLAPLGPTSKIICVGLNYRGHVAETGRDEIGYPTLFTRFADSHVAPGAPLVQPAASGRFDFEGELAVFIGRGGRHIPASEAMAHVGGYSCYNDGSVRDWQRHSTQFTAGKNFANTAAIGPWVVTADDIADPASLSITTRLNGEVMQHATLVQMMHSIPALIEYISTFTPLGAGDVIATGTPEGVGAFRTPPVWMRPGDRIEVEIPGVGLLVNDIVAESVKPTAEHSGDVAAGGGGQPQASARVHP